MGGRDIHGGGGFFDFSVFLFSRVVCALTPEMKHEGCSQISMLNVRGLVYELSGGLHELVDN